MTLIRSFVISALLVALVASSAAQAMNDGAAQEAIAFAAARLAAEAARSTPLQSPNFTKADGTWVHVANTDVFGWTQGFFPGANWLAWDLTHDAAAKSRAVSWTRALEVQKTNTQTHDLGFKLFLSFGHAFQATGDPYYKDVLLTAAASLATRYDPTIGAIICCDWNPDWHRPTVVDTMMNLELLLWASQNGGQAAWKDMAVNHALKTLADTVRDDGSTFHVVDYLSDGSIAFRGTSQGYSNSSTWTRGQAWAIYGFTTVYRYTRDARMLAAAKKVTDYYLTRLGSDPVPNWDFDAPSLHKDSSAGAAVASALFELSGYVGSADALRYRAAATQMLDALASPAYLAKGTSSQSALRWAVGNLPGNEQIDVGLIYGDYYFLEALSRRPADPPAPADGGVNDADAGVSDAGAADAGVVDAGNADGGSLDAGPGAFNQPASDSRSTGCSTGDSGLASFLPFALLACVLARRRLRRGTLWDI